MRSCFRNVPPSANAFQQNRQPYGRSPYQFKFKLMFNFLFSYHLNRLMDKSVKSAAVTCVNSHMNLLRTS